MSDLDYISGATPYWRLPRIDPSYWHNNPRQLELECRYSALFDGKTQKGWRHDKHDFMPEDLAWIAERAEYHRKVLLSA